MQYTVQDTEETHIEIDLTRTSIIFYNNHATATLYINFHKDIGTGQGFPIPAEGSISFSVPEDDPRVAYWVISDTADTDMRTIEGHGWLDERWFKPR